MGLRSHGDSSLFMDFGASSIECVFSKVQTELNVHRPRCFAFSSASDQHHEVTFLVRFCDQTRLS